MTYLKEINACESAQNWADAQKDYETAWKICERGDWMLWIAAKQKIAHKKLTLAKARCESLVKHLIKDERALKAIEVAEKYGKGEATREDLKDAAAAADTAAGAFAAAAAAAAAAARAETLKKCADIARELISFDELNIK